MKIKLMILIMASQVVFNSGLASKAAQQQLETIKQSFTQAHNELDSIFNAKDKTNDQKLEVLRNYVKQLANAILELAATEQRQAVFWSGVKKAIEKAEKINIEPN